VETLNLRRIPISGWSQCVHEVASFESEGEYCAATVLDNSKAVNWWFRNDPVVLRIPTLVGYFEPDFVYLAERAGKVCYGIMEIKGGIFWDGEGSTPRLKSAAARRWVQAVNEAGAEQWEYSLVLDCDAVGAGSLEELLRNAQEIEPAREI